MPAYRKWFAAHEAPRAFGGQRVWVWRDWPNIVARQPTLEYWPTDYSRRPNHCEGIYVQLLNEPGAPPNVQHCIPAIRVEGAHDGQA